MKKRTGKEEIINNIRFVFFLLPILYLFFSCDSNRVYERNVEIQGGKWDNHNLLTFQFSIQDTLSLYNMYINIRNKTLYQYSNLYLFVTNTFPNGNHFTDTVECILADPKGKWLGKGTGNLIMNQIMYRKHIRFPLRGTYTVQFEQAMRDAVLPQIYDAGLRVEKAR